MCAILMCFAVDCANLCKAAGVCNWQSWEPSKVAPSPPPHTRHTLCHCQLTLFQSYDGDHNENDADNDVDDVDDGDDVLLHTLFTLCATANWRFSNILMVIIMKMTLIMIVMIVMMVMTYFSSHSSRFVPTGAFPRAPPHQRHSKWTCDSDTHVFDVHPPEVIVQQVKKTLNAKYK